MRTRTPVTIVTNRLQPAVIGLCGHVAFVPLPRSLRKPILKAKSSVPVHFFDSHSMWGMIANVNWHVDSYLLTLSMRDLYRDRHGGGILRFPSACALLSMYWLAPSVLYARVCTLMTNVSVQIRACGPVGCWEVRRHFLGVSPFLSGTSVTSESSGVEGPPLASTMMYCTQE